MLHLPRPLFVYFCTFQTTNFTEKTVMSGVSGMRTRIVGLEGKHADPLLTFCKN